MIRNWNLFTFFKAIPVPRATALRGSSAIWKGIFNVSLKRLSKPPAQPILITKSILYKFNNADTKAALAALPTPHLTIITSLS